MQTLYIDVYFLINFSVDSLAMYFALKLIGNRIQISRLLLSSVLLALASCLYLVLWEGKIEGYFVLITTYILSLKICVKNGGISRWLLLSFSFLFISFLMGGFVFWGYEKLNELSEKLNIDTNYGAENRKMLLFASLILMTIMLLKLLIMLLERRKMLRSARLCFMLFGVKYDMDALVDTGCFLVEPLSGKLVFLVKRSAMSKDGMPRLDDALAGDDLEWKKRMRLIPYKSLGGSRMLVAYLTENVEIITNNQTLRTSLYLALDEEGGSYGGYCALLPFSVLNNA